MTATSRSVSWIDRTAGAVTLAKDADETRRQFKGLRDNRDDLAELLTDCQALVEGAGVARPLGWVGRLPNPELTAALRTTAGELDSRALNQAARQLRRFRDDVKAALLEWWSTYAADRLGDVTELRVLADTLGGVEGVVDLSHRLETILGELARAQSEIPTVRSVALLEEAGEVLASMEQSLQPESVRQFLSAVARGGAALDLMNQDVVAWLRAHHAERNFKIIAGSPAGDADA